MGTDTDDWQERHYVHNTQGERSAASIRVTVSHDLGDRTLVVVILLACVIGVCGFALGRDQASYDMQGQYMRDVAAKQQVMINHMKDVETTLEKSHAN